MKDFLERYALITTTEDITTRYIKDPTGKFCRFCRKPYPEVSFNTIPHILPELFGRNNITSNVECDACNQYFQRYESDTATMIQHYLTMLHVRTKHGVPSFQSKKTPETSSTQFSSNGSHLKLDFGTNLSDFQYDYVKKTLTVHFRTRKFRPYSVYKVFLKIAISLLTEEEIQANSHFLEFLFAEEPIDNGMQDYTVTRYMLKTKYYERPKVNLYKAVRTVDGTNMYPEYMILINFSNVIYQFFLPISTRNMNEFDSRHRRIVQLFPAYYLDDIRRLTMVDMYFLDLNNREKVSVTDSLVLHYKELIRSEGGSKDGGEDLT